MLPFLLIGAVVALYFWATATPSPVKGELEAGGYGLGNPPPAGLSGPISPAMTGGSPAMNQSNMIRMETNVNPVAHQGGPTTYGESTELPGLPMRRQSTSTLPSAAGAIAPVSEGGWVGRPPR